MVLGFKKRFVAPILEGYKLHSIREDVNNRWRPGMTIHMATGTRSKYYNCFNETPCISTQRIFMSYDGVLHVSIGTGNNEKELYDEELEQLAKQDGFKDFADFEKWWLPELAKRESNSYSGKIIHWTDFRY